MYPLDKDPEESERLNSQFNLLEGEWLTLLFKESSGSVLDVGCGTGHLHTKIPPTWKYIGIDSTDRFENKSPNQEFIHKDILDFTTDLRFDVIICRLVLWSLPKRELVLKKLHELAHSNTIIHCYEPDDSKLEFNADLKAMNDLALNWQQTVIPQGSNPFIGNSLEHLLLKNGWHVIAKKVHEFHYSSHDPQFIKHLENLHRIFSQCNPQPSQVLKENAKAAIIQNQGNFRENYVEIVAKSQAISES